MRTRQWRRLERRAVAGYERDLLTAIDELCAVHSVVTAVEVAPVGGRTAKIELDGRRLVLGPLAPVGLALLLTAIALVAEPDAPRNLASGRDRNKPAPAPQRMAPAALSTGPSAVSFKRTAPA